MANDPRTAGVRSGPIRCDDRAKPVVRALPINAIEDLTARIVVKKVGVGQAVVIPGRAGDAMF